MYIAIDDTYGPVDATGTKYVTGARRTNVGIAFEDSEVDDIRQQISECIDFVKTEFSIDLKEFHFTDIYNRKGVWANLPENANLLIISFFANIYSQYRWKVFIQTIDDRTLKDHKIKKITGKIGKFNLEKRSDLSLVFLLIKIKKYYSNTNEGLNIIIDEGLAKPNATVGRELFHDFPNEYHGIFQASNTEPLLQLADFIAFAVNRSTHLYMKEKRTELDNWFLSLFGEMDINSDDLRKAKITGVLEDFSISDFDSIHEVDRYIKGLQPC